MDMEAVRRRLAELANKNKGGGSKLKKVWKPKDEHTVRAVMKPGTDDPFEVRHFHGGIPNEGKNFPFSCPKNHGEDCPVCDFAKTLARWKDENGNDRPEEERKAEFEIFKKIQSKPRYYLPIIERGKEADGVQWWSMTENNYNKLLTICADADWNADRQDGGGIAVLTSTVAGLDLTVSYREPGKKGNATGFTKVEVEPRKKMTKLHDDPKEAKKIVDSIYSLDDTMDGKQVTAKQAHVYLSEWLNLGKSEDEAAAAGKKDVEYHEKPASQNAEKLTGTKTVEEKLEELFAAQ